MRFLSSLTSGSADPSGLELPQQVSTPVVDSLCGVLPEDVDRGAYRDYLGKKY